ncbi:MULTISPECIES: riboflavin kinase [Arthrobacter]|uniref:riboflavin kinase n=1 Tax=Arthrobacter TaxID=1663 RepID=UPI00140479C5|nr:MULTISPECIES: riboflavin kinase [Arthrobacter]MBT8163689.1 riboflavin kinase [Arthrobacter sp. GN70]
MKRDPLQSNAPARTLPFSKRQDRDFFQVTGMVDHGDHRGRLLGFPTANIAIPENDVLKGVWAGTVHIGPLFRRSLYVAAVSVGDRPTYYSQGHRLLEANLLDFTGDLYGKTVVVTLRSLIRPQRKFSGTDELVDQIQDDVSRVRKWALEAGLGGYLGEVQELELSKSHGARRP